MNMMSKRLCAVSASALLAVSMAIPASAATPWTPAAGASAQPRAVQVQYRRHHGHHRFEMRQGRPYYHGHRGYRHYRHGYRQYNGYWFPPAAFIAGAIIGGAMASPAPRRGGSAHVRWCEQHYRSYDPRTDTYQPYHGPRKRCVSPY